MGTAKYVTKLWITRGILNNDNITIIEECVSNIHCPIDIGRLPLKIGSGFAGFTASQWRYWTTVFSAIALKGHIPIDDFNCWLLYVRACNLLCAQHVTIEDVQTADRYLHLFCKKYESLYGEECCTINMHLHLHLRECVLDYGPSPSFWCFSFERFNGVLGSYPTNNKSAEEQLMKRFLREQYLKGMKYESDDVQMKSVIGSLQGDEIIKLHNAKDVLHLMDLSKSSLPPLYINGQLPYALSNEDEAKTLPPYYEKVFTSDSYAHLHSLYSKLYPNANIVEVPKFYIFAKKVVLCGQAITSVYSASETSNVILADWPITGDEISHCSKNVGQVQHFLRHVIKCNVGGDIKKFEHIFAYVLWYKVHESRHWYGASAIVSQISFENIGPYNFLPIQRIQCRCAFGKINVTLPSRTEQLHISSPLQLNYAV